MPPHTRPLVFPGILIGIGLAGTLDEVILHQLLHWHHLYDRSTDAAGLVSDGIFHLASTSVLVLGLTLALSRLWRDPDSAGAGRMTALTGATLIGLGGFNLYDGTVQHKILRIHQVRPAVADWLPYDLAFNGFALAMLLLGALILRRSGDRAPESTIP